MNEKTFRVLIVEDNPGDARLIQQMLLEASADKGLPSTIEWIHKQNLRDAIACLEETQVRIVLLDLTLPDSHGTNTFQQMQQAFPLTPIIVLSGIDHEDTAVSALQHGIQEYLVKGRFDTYLLSRAIRYAIERQRLRADLEKQHQALLDSEARRQSLMENTPDGIVIVNKDKLIRFVNLPAAQILGQVKEDLVGQLFIISYEPHQIITQTFTKPDGETAVVELRTIPSEWHGESVYILYLRDITQQKHAEKSIQERDEQLRSILASMDDLVFVLDKEGRFLSYSYPTEASGIRAAPSFIFGKSYQEILPEHVVPTFKNVIDEIQKSEWVQHIEYPLYNQGKDFWFSAKISSRKNVKGEIAGLTMVIRDITELKQAEQKLRQKTSQLESLRQISLELTEKRDWETLLNAIVDQAVELFGGQEGCIYLYEEQFNSLVSAMPDRLNHVLNEKVVERSRNLAFQVLETNKLTITYPYSSASSNGNAQNRHAIIGVPIRWRETFLGVLTVIGNKKRQFSNTDAELFSLFASQAAVTIQNAQFHKQIQLYNSELEDMVSNRTEMLTQANARLQILDEIKSKFINDISHNLRTPTTNIQLYLALLKRGTEEKKPHYLSVLNKEAGRLEKLIEGIISYSSLLTIKDSLEFCSVDLCNIVTNVMVSSKKHAKQHCLTLDTNFDDQLPHVHGNNEQLREMVTQLVTNAINYSQHGNITLSVSHQLEDEFVCLQVEDQGIGINQGELGHIFERFYRGYEVGQSNIPGIGLGLAIVKEIVDIHNGRINVTSQKDIGTTFRVWLPIRKEKTEDVYNAN